ncbi:MAG: hypothetical protein AMXMBFR33_20640 [Candidatus Xenobia bacterium]
MSLTQRVTALLCVWLLYAAAGAQPADTSSPSLDQVYRLAEERSPALQAAQARAQAARGALLQAGMSPNPSLGIQGSHDLSVVSDIGLYYSQPIELGGKRQARIHLAEAQLALAELGLIDQQNRLRRDVHQALADLALAQGLASLQDELLQVAQMQLDATRKRLQAGDVAEVDLLELEAEVARRKALHSQALGRERAAWRSLEVWVGPDQAPFPAELGPAPELSQLSLEALQARARAERPDRLQALARTRVQEMQIGLEEARASGDLNLKVGVGHERLYIPSSSFQPSIVSLDDSGVAANVQLEIPLTIFDTNEGNIEQARALAEAARLDEAALLQTIDRDVARAWDTLLAADEAARELRQTGLERAREFLRIVQQAYELGMRTQFEVIAAREAYQRMAEQVLQADYAARAAQIELETAVGGPLSGTPPTQQEAP